MRWPLTASPMPRTACADRDADSDFEGRCQVIDRDVANLNDLGLGEAISSLRQIR